MKRSRTLAGAIVGATILAGCSSGNDDTQESTTTSTTSTTIEVSPEEAFRQDLTAALNSDQPGFEEATLDLGQTLCRTIDEAETGIAEDDAENDTPESDAISDAVVTMAIVSVYEPLTEGDRDPQVAATIMRLTGEHLCPDHAEAIEEVLVARGQ